MPVDISERLSEIIPILSFLRVAEEWHKSPAIVLGFLLSARCEIIRPLSEKGMSDGFSN